MFLGKALHTLDSKSRLTIPAKYRDLLAPTLVVTRHPTEDCLMLLPLREWDAFANKINHLSLVDEKAARLRRKVFSAAEVSKLDSQGRILMSADLCKHAKISDSVLTVGMNSHVELWNPEIWETEVEPQFDDVELNRQIFAALGI